MCKSSEISAWFPTQSAIALIFGTATFIGQRPYLNISVCSMAAFISLNGFFQIVRQYLAIYLVEFALMCLSSVIIFALALSPPFLLAKLLQFVWRVLSTNRTLQWDIYV